MVVYLRLLFPPNTPADARAATASLINNAVEPYIMSGTISYQRELTRGTVLELRYLHTAGRHLPSAGSAQRWGCGQQQVSHADFSN